MNTGALDPAERDRRPARARRELGARRRRVRPLGGGVAGRRHLAEGLERADSWATDGHKWLNVPYDCGIVLVRDLRDLDGRDGGRRDLPREAPSASLPELRPRCRAGRAASRCGPRSGPSDGGARGDGRAHLPPRDAVRRAALRAAGYEILNDVVLNQVLVSFGDAETTSRVIAAIQEDGTCWCGRHRVAGQAAMRISVPRGRRRRPTSSASPRYCGSPAHEREGCRPGDALRPARRGAGAARRRRAHALAAGAVSRRRRVAQARGPAADGLVQDPRRVSPS